MLRRLFTVSSALSLLACIIFIAIWARSHWVADEVKFVWAHGVVWAWTPKGSVEVGLYRGDWSRQPANSYGWHREPSPIDRPINSYMFMEIDPPDRLVAWQWGGFAWYSIRHTHPGDVNAEAAAPFWSIACATALLPSIWILLRLRSGLRTRRQKSAGLCPSCGYDLRATPGRCPECGAGDEGRKVAPQRSGPGTVTRLASGFQ